jgi:hypothetical protein
MIVTESLIAATAATAVTALAVTSGAVVLGSLGLILSCGYTWRK